jgi:hypothetical protein
LFYQIYVTSTIQENILSESLNTTQENIVMTTRSNRHVQNTPQHPH